MATTFLEPGGDADFQTPVGGTNYFWSTISGTVSLATDFVHGNHQKSIKFRPANSDVLSCPAGYVSAGTRLSFYLYINATKILQHFVLIYCKLTSIFNKFRLYIPYTSCKQNSN